MSILRKMRLSGLSQFESINIPLVLQGILTASLPYFDALLLSRIGEEQLSAIAISTSILLVIFSVQITFAQIIIALKEPEDNKNIRNFIATLTIALALNALVTLALYTKLDWIIHLFIKNDHIIKYVKQYLDLMIYTVPITQITLCCGFFLRSYGKTKLTLYSFLLEVPVNIILTGILIYIFDQGVFGAAVGSVVARTLRLELMLVHTWRHIQSILPKDFKWIARPANGYISKFMSLNLSLIIGNSFFSISSLLVISILSNYSIYEFSVYSLIVNIKGLGLTVMNAVSSTSAVILKTLAPENSNSQQRYCTKKFKTYLRYSVVFFSLVSLITINISTLELPDSTDFILILILIELIALSHAAYYSTAYLKIFGYHVTATIIELLFRCALQVTGVYIISNNFNNQISAPLMFLVLTEIINAIFLRRYYKHYLVPLAKLRTRR